MRKEREANKLSDKREKVEETRKRTTVKQQTTRQRFIARRNRCSYHKAKHHREAQSTVLCTLLPQARSPGQSNPRCDTDETEFTQTLCHTSCSSILRMTYCD